MDRRSALRGTASAVCVGALPLGARGSAPLRIGLTAVILADQAAFLGRWARDLGRRIGASTRFVVRDEYRPILDLLFRGDLEAAWICGFPFVKFEPLLRLLAVPLHEGQPLYRAYLIRARGNPARVGGWSDLKGKVLAYSDPLSNSGWLVAQQQLSEAGVQASDFKRSFFAHGHRNVAEAVASRLADAGSIDGYVWETMRMQGMAAAERTEVVWQSSLHGFPPLVTHTRISPPEFRTLQAALLSMTSDEEGRRLLRALNLTGFAPGSPALFDSIRALAARAGESPAKGVVAGGRG